VRTSAWSSGHSSRPTSTDGSTIDDANACTLAARAPHCRGVTQSSLQTLVEQEDSCVHLLPLECTADVLLTKPPMFVSGAFPFYEFCRQNMEPTSGLEPLTCSLRVIIRTLQRFAQDCKSHYLGDFLFCGLPCVAPNCARGGVKVVSTSAPYPPSTTPALVDAHSLSNPS
jgi:hypothetical protein